MELDQAISSRRSVRDFTNKKAAWDKVIEAIDSAIQSPVATNSLPLKFVIVQDPKTIFSIAKAANQPWIANSKMLILICSDHTHLEKLYGEKGLIYGRQQAGASIQNFLLKITDLGLATCWIGSYDEDKIRSLAEIPKEINVEAILPLGYAKKKAPKPKKPSLESSIYWEKWGNKRRPTLIKDPEMW